MHHGHCTYYLNSRPAFSYNKQHLEVLLNLELIETEKINQGVLATKRIEEEIKLLKLPAVVRGYVYSKLPLAAVYEISKNVANIHLGHDWRNGKISFCKLSKEQFSAYYKVIGSTQVLLVQLLKCAIELNIGRDVDSSFRACKIFCHQISSAGKYKDVISFSKQVRAVAKESDKITSLAFFDLQEGKALRMLSNYSEAEVMLKNALRDEVALTKKDKISVLINLMLIYEKKDLIEDAIAYAKKIIGLDRSNSDATLVLELQSESSDIDKLKLLESKFRGKERFISANNTAIKISIMENSVSSKVRWLNKVITCPGKDRYNKLRAVIQKARLTYQSDEYKPTDTEMMLLHSCYTYSFSQGLNSMFNDAHQVLWKYYTDMKNYNTVFNLYRHSSLYWRIYSDLEKEKNYSELIMNLTRFNLPNSIDLTAYENAYAVHRAKLLTE